MKSPAFQFYPDDFVGSGTVQAADADEIGAYTLLLCLDWGEVGFEYDEKRLAKVCRLSRARFRVVWSHLAAKFPARDGRHYNPRLEREREKQAEWHAKSSAGGKKGAAARWGGHNHPHIEGDGGGHKGGHRMVITTASPNDDTPVSSLQTPSPLQPPTTAARSQKRDRRPREPKPRETWLTPIGAEWEKVNGKGSFPWGQAAGELGNLTEAGHTPEKIARHLAWYLRVRGLDTVDPDPEVIARRQFTPNLKDFRLRFGRFDPERAA